jgi:hypothetical protein
MLKKNFLKGILFVLAAISFGGCGVVFSSPLPPQGPTPPLEYSCPAGFSVLPNGTLYDQVAQRYRQWLCGDLNGRAFVHSGNPEIFPESRFLGFGDEFLTAESPNSWSGQVIILAATHSDLTFTGPFLDGQFNFVNCYSATATDCTLHGSFSGNPSGSVSLTPGQTALVTSAGTATLVVSVFGGGSGPSGACPGPDAGAGAIVGVIDDDADCGPIPNWSFDLVSGTLTSTGAGILVDSNDENGIQLVVEDDGGIGIQDFGPGGIDLVARGSGQIRLEQDADATGNIVIDIENPASNGELEITTLAQGGIVIHNQGTGGVTVSNDFNATGPVSVLINNPADSSSLELGNAGTGEIGLEAQQGNISITSDLGVISANAGGGIQINNSSTDFPLFITDNSSEAAGGLYIAESGTGGIGIDTTISGGTSAISLSSAGGIFQTDNSASGLVLTESDAASSILLLADGANQTWIEVSQGTGPELQCGGDNTFANLPASPVAGSICPIADSNVIVFGATITAGGGAGKGLAYYDGTNWTFR